jgi:prenyltransferase beta subunit
MAVQTLAMLDALDKETVGGTVRYLEGAMGLLGVPGKLYRTFSTMQAAADNLTALATMKALDEVETSPILAFVESLYIAQNGGFGPSPGFGTSPPSTYLGVYCLKLLGKLPEPTAQAERVQDAKP